MNRLHGFTLWIISSSSLSEGLLFREGLPKTGPTERDGTKVKVTLHHGHVSLASVTVQEADLDTVSGVRSLFIYLARSPTETGYSKLTPTLRRCVKCVHFSHMNSEVIKINCFVSEYDKTSHYLSINTTDSVDGPGL